MKIETRPWGWFWKIIARRHFWVKFIRVNPNHRTSLQTHRLRDEYVMGISKIKRGQRHRLSHGFYLEMALGEPKESDVKRIQDDYNR